MRWLKWHSWPNFLVFVGVIQIMSVILWFVGPPDLSVTSLWLPTLVAAVAYLLHWLFHFIIIELS